MINNYRENNSRMLRKNEPKFEYLDGIAIEMGIRFDELIGNITFNYKSMRLHLNAKILDMVNKILRFFMNLYYDRSVPVVDTLGVTQAEDFNRMKQNSWISRMLDGKSFYCKCEFEKKLVIKKEKAQAKVKVYDSKLKVMNDKAYKTNWWRTDVSFISTVQYKCFMAAPCGHE